MANVYSPGTAPGVLDWSDRPWSYRGLTIVCETRFKSRDGWGMPFGGCVRRFVTGCV